MIWFLVSSSACAGDGTPEQPDAPGVQLDARAPLDMLVDADTASERDAAVGVEEPVADASSPADDSLCALLSRRAGTAAPNKSLVAWSTLLCETVDLERFTQLAQTPYQARMASSYNRASIQEGQPGWFANPDSGFYLREQGDEHVMMEASGPGVITRLWTPKPSGRIRIYIDDPTTPVLDMPMAELFSNGVSAPWGAPFVFEAAEGHNSYFPIPYASYARVSTTSSDQLYYQVDHRVYADDVQVEPFSRAGLALLAPLARELAAIVADPATDPRQQGLATHTLELTGTAPEQAVVLGPSVIRELTVRGFESTDEALRGTRLILTVDGERTVDAPLGDLFGAGPGLLPFQSLAAAMTAETLTLRWPMPVGDTFSARLETSVSSPTSLSVQLRHASTASTLPLRFHARWSGVQTFSSRTAEDWTLLHYRGTGWYVGTLLNVGNPTNLWWGEGDEKIFVDGESFPGHFGTGTEDYFGMGWCSTKLVARPWLGQTRADGPANAGRTSVFRWHLADAIPFRSELRFRLEVLHWFNQLVDLPLAQDAVAYWYSETGGHEQTPPLPNDAFVIPPLHPVTVPTLPGASSCKI